MQNTPNHKISKVSMIMNGSEYSGPVKGHGFRAQVFKTYRHAY